MITLDNRYNFKTNIDLLNKIKDSLTSKEIELIFITDDAIADINRDFRGKDYATDVLSFPLIDMPNSPLGTIIISIDRVKEKANDFGHCDNDELSLLFIHGLLHLLGFDHEKDNGLMRDKERELIEKFGLPKSLILRSE